MSAIYFHSRTGEEARLSGAERAHLRQVAIGAAIGALGIDDPFREHWVYKAVRPRLRPGAERFIATTLAVGHDTKLAMPGLPEGSGEYAAIDVLLNTAIVLGSPVVQLAARLHGYCESHCYVEGADRYWLVDIIEQGLKTNVLRSKLLGNGLGWEDVVRLLCAPESQDPVSEIVCSFSVCDSFPNKPDAWDQDTWYDLSKDEQWSIALPGIRQKPWLRISPETLGKPCFGSTLTLFDFDAAWSGPKPEVGVYLSTKPAQKHVCTKCGGIGARNHICCERCHGTGEEPHAG